MTTPSLARSPFDEVARRLGEMLAEAPAEAPRLQAFESAPAPGTVVAIDGSSAVLAASGAFLVGAHRAASVRLSGRGPPIVSAAEPEVVLLEPRRVSPEARKRLSAAGFEDRVESPDMLLHLLRELDEQTAARAALESLSAGDALLLDGPVRLAPFPTLMRGLLEDAKAQGVDVVGVCKSTSLTVGRVPALAACHLAARQARLRRWAVELVAPANVPARVFIAALSLAEARAFRFDVVPAVGEPLDVLARVAALARHPAYPGYPAPLALAHNEVTITEATKERLVSALGQAAQQYGVTHDAWRAAFEDYHDILDLGV